MAKPGKRAPSGAPASDPAKLMAEELPLEQNPPAAPGTEAPATPITAYRPARANLRPSSKPGPKPKAERADAVRSALDDTFSGVCITLSFVSPTAGAFLELRHQKNIAAAMRILERHPDWMRKFEQGGEMIAWAELGMTLAGVGVAVAVDFGRVAPDTLVASSMGVTAAYEKVVEAEAAEGDQTKPGSRGRGRSDGFMGRTPQTAA